MDENLIKQKTKEWFNGDELATQVWLSKYALKNKSKEILEESPKERYKAIADELVRVSDHWFHQFANYGTKAYKAMINGEITPAGSGLYGIGNPYSISSLGNCFVISGNKEDSYGSILRLDQELVQIAKRRGGIGFDISHLRPSGVAVQNAALSSSGATSFMSRYSSSTREVAQDGRRGALMLTMHINHPDIMEFIKAKRDITKITGANISIKITDQFMRAVENDSIHYFRYPVDLPIDKYILNYDESTEKPPEGKYGSIRARDLWAEIIKSNWLGAEPGLLFWDKIIRESPADCYYNFKTESTNPCSELPLSPYDSCRLLSVNLVMIILKAYTEESGIDYDKLEYLIRLAVRMMDDIVDLEVEKIEKILEKITDDKEYWTTKQIEYDLWIKILTNTKRGRRLGISVIGHADFLAALGVKYDSDEALVLLENIHEKVRNWAYDASIELAKERGTFPEYDFDLEVDNPFLQRLPQELKDKMKEHGRRHIALLTEPPAGSLAIVLRIASGMEPVFNPYYNRRRKVNPNNGDRVDVVDDIGDSWQEYKVIHPGIERWYSTVFGDDIPLSAMTDEGLDLLISKSPYAGCFANDIDPLFKVKMQGTIQKYIDHGISITYNLPEDIKEEAVGDLYMAAWKAGTKGMTIYREGSRSGVLINKKKEEDKSEFNYYDAPKRPRILPCDVYHPTIHGEQYIVLVGLFDGKPYEVMAVKSDDVSVPASMREGNLVKQRSTVYNLTDEAGEIIVEDIISKFGSPEWDALTRLTSTALRHGADISFVVEQLNKSAGSIVEVAKVIARTLKKYTRVQEIAKGKPCPQCGDPLVIEGGCEQCINPECGYGKCM